MKSLLSPQHRHWLLLFLFAVPLFFMNIDTTHSWGDDFAQYIKEAQNIANGKPFYQSNYIYNHYNHVYAPPQYPPGFPLILAPVVGIFGLSLKAMYYFNSLLAAALLFTLFSYFRKRNAGITAAICLAVLITYSGLVISMKSNILSDLPCLLLVTLYLTLRHTERLTWHRVLLLIAVLTLAILTRTQCIVMLTAEAVVFVIQLTRLIAQSISKRKANFRAILTSCLPVVAIIGGTLLLYDALSHTIFYAPVKTDDFYNYYVDLANKSKIEEVIEHNINFLFNSVPAYFYYDSYNGYSKAIISAVGKVMIGFGVAGFVISLVKGVKVDDVFFVGMCIVVMYFPAPDPRYFLPAVPMLYYYCYVAFRTIVPAVTHINVKWVAIIVTLFYLRLGFGYMKSTIVQTRPGMVPKAKDLAAFDYLKQHVNDSDIIIFTKPRLLTLYTGKRAMHISWALTQQRNREILDSMHVKYMLIVDNLEDDFFKIYVRETQKPVDSARIADGYTLYTLR